MTDLCGDITIVQARYGGGYEPGKWLAFPLDVSSLPRDWDGGDVECANFWSTYGGVVGAGRTPDEALTSLTEQMGTS